MWVCSGTQSDSRPCSSSARASSAGWMERSLAKMNAPIFIEMSAPGSGERFGGQVPKLVGLRRGPERAHSSWVSEDRRSSAARWGAWASKIRRFREHSSRDEVLPLPPEVEEPVVVAAGTALALLLVERLPEPVLVALDRQAGHD